MATCVEVVLEIVGIHSLIKNRKVSIHEKRVRKNGEIPPPNFLGDSSNSTLPSSRTQTCTKIKHLIVGCILATSLGVFINRRAPFPPPILQQGLTNIIYQDVRLNLARRGDLLCLSTDKKGRSRTRCCQRK